VLLMRQHQLLVTQLLQKSPDVKLTEGSVVAGTQQQGSFPLHCNHGIVVADIGSGSEAAMN
jgi:hypothetical protein